MRALPEPPLLVISDRGQARADLTDIARLLLDAGCRWFSLREKDLPGSDRRRLIGELLPLFAERSAVLCLHDGDADLAVEMGLQALHLPAEGDLRSARKLMGEDARIGLSCHDRDSLKRAAEEGANYATLSPVFKTASKPGYAPFSQERTAELLAGARLPVLALGGIEAAEEAKACRRMGAAGLAVMGSVMRAGDPVGVFRALASGWSAGD